MNAMTDQSNGKSDEPQSISTAKSMSERRCLSENARLGSESRGEWQNISSTEAIQTDADV
jgi:hypothetical protein